MAISMTAAETQPVISATQDQRPGLAMIANVMAPYRRNLHKLVAEGVPELKVHTLITHGPAEFTWNLSLPESIHASFFSAPGDSPLAGTLRHPVREWHKGGRLIEYLQAHGVRAVILFGYRYLSFLRVIRYCRRTGIPAFVHNDSNIHGDRHMPSWKRTLKSAMYRGWLTQVSGVMSMGEYGDDFFLRYGADPEGLYRVPWPVDEDYHSRVTEERLQRFRQKFGLSDDRRYLLFSGRLVAVKRVDLLIDAFAAIADERPDWDLVIVGEGVLGEELRQRVPNALRSRIVWTGFLDGDEPALAYNAADVLVLPSDFEPWALVIQEAMAAGLAVVASDVVGAARELIQDKSSGRIFPAGRLGTLIEALMDVTAPTNIERYQAEATRALADWSRTTDPIAEVRRALVKNGVLGAAVN
jgi:glycosyltransferase involved in cell wall biosynthesis